MRKPSDISSVQTAKLILSETSRKGSGNWSRLAQDYESKINSGDIVAVAEVARDLFRAGDSYQSFSERKLYVSALDRLCCEIALVGGISTEQAIVRVKRPPNTCLGQPRQLEVIALSQFECQSKGAALGRSGRVKPARYV
jgi:RNA polymerase-interacting CarD/CdnL/TRCF family regulator